MDLKLRKECAARVATRTFSVCKAHENHYKRFKDGFVEKFNMSWPVIVESVFLLKIDTNVSGPGPLKVYCSDTYIAYCHVGIFPKDRREPF